MAQVTTRKSGVEFDLRTDPPIKEFNFRISRFTKGITDWSGALRAYGELFKRHMAQAFETEGADTGSRWPAVSPAWALWKATHGPLHSRKIGVYKGDLRSSMTGGGGYSEHITKTSGDYGMSTSSKAKPYGAYFAEKRPVVRFQAKHGREYQKVTHAWVVAEERSAFGSGGSAVASTVRLGGITGSVQSIDLRNR